MIAMNDTLSSLLDTSNNLIVCNLFAYTLKSGSVYYASDFDRDVVYNGNTYKHDFFLSTSDTMKLTGYPTTDTVNVTINADQNHEDNVDGKFVLQAAVDGDWDDAQCVVMRAFFTSDYTLAGVVTLFVGTVKVDSVSGITCEFDVESDVVGMGAKVPLRIFAPQTAYAKNDNGIVTTVSTDNYTMCIPLKPNQSILGRW